MWIYSKPRTEHDIRLLLNLDHATRINISQLGERWFVDVMFGNESVPVASANTQEDAYGVLQQIFDGIEADRKALDLDTPDT